MSKLFIQDFIFQPARKTAAEWKNENPILRDGEFGIVSDGGESEWLKVGDGAAHWNDLPFKKGTKGEPGYTPVKGVDYFTEEDIEGLGKQDKFASVTETDTNDGKKRTVLTSGEGHYLAVKSPETINIEARQIELNPLGGSVRLNSRNGDQLVKIQNVKDPSTPQEAATKKYVDNKASSKQISGIEASLITNGGERRQLSLIARNQNGHITAVGSTADNTFDFTNVQTARIELALPETVNNTDCYFGQVYYKTAASEPKLMGIFETRKNNLYTAPLNALPASSMTRIYLSFTLMS